MRFEDEVGAVGAGRGDRVRSEGAAGKVGGRGGGVLGGAKGKVLRERKKPSEVHRNGIDEEWGS